MISTVYNELVCQLCRTEHPSRLDKNVCCSTHPRSMRPLRFLACDGPGCHERVFVGHRCSSCGTMREDRR